MKLTIPTLLAVCVLCLSSAVAAENPDLDKLQGKWECKKTDENGQKVTLTIEFKKDKLSFQIQGGTTFFATADVKTEKLGPFKVFTAHHVKGGDSKDDLQEMDEEFSHVYQVDSDTLYVASNFEKQRERPPTLDVYKKASKTK